MDIENAIPSEDEVKDGSYLKDEPPKKKRSRRHGMLGCPDCDSSLRSVNCSLDGGGLKVIQNYVACGVCNKIYEVKYEEPPVIIRKK